MILFSNALCISILIGISLCFIVPVVISQSFKNQEHPFFIIVLIVGSILSFLAVYYGYRGISNILNGTLGPKNKLN